MGMTLLCGVFLVLTWVALIPGWTGPRSEVFAWISVGFGAYFALGSAGNSIKVREIDVNLLMVVAAIGAIAVGHPDDAAVLLFLFSLSSALESMAMAKTQSAIESLVKLRPAAAIRISGDTELSVPVEELAIGDQVRVLPFEPIPADGVLLTDSAEIDESAMTGESRPVSRTQGMALMTGTQNLDRMLIMRVTAESKDSALEKIVALVAEAQENKASGERISSWFGARYTIFVIAAFLVSLGIRLAIHETPPTAFYQSLVLLVALSPCAIVISSPAASLSGLGFAARRGILVRGGQYLEEAGRITMAALDKTGTLTQGKPHVVEICVGERAMAHAGPDCGKDCPLCTCMTCWHGGELLNTRAQEVLRLAASAEAFSTHPIAEAICAFAAEKGITAPEAKEQSVVPGLGVEAIIDGERVRVGQPKLFTENELPGGFRDHVEEMRSRGLTAVLLESRGSWAAIGVMDTVRPEAKSFIDGLRSAGVQRIAMLSGDNLTTAKAAAAEVGITEVYAPLMPEGKFELIDKWTKDGERVLMVGDGVNDAPALGAASLGAAMGGLGSEAALRAADVVLVQDRIQLLPLLVRLGKKTNGVIRFNLFFAAAVIVCLAAASFMGVLPLPIAVVGHEGSTALVVLNGLRLLRGVKG